MEEMDWVFENIYHMAPVEIKSRFQYLGEGISRIVYAIDNNFVAKLAKCQDGFDQCALEYIISNNECLRYGKYLCPVVYYRPGMVVMPRTVPMTKLRHGRKFNIKKLGNDVYHDLKNLALQYNLLFDDIKSASSRGIWMNRPVLIDYGCTN